MAQDARALRRFLRNRGALVGLALVVALLAFALLGPWFLSSPLVPDFEHGRGPFGTPDAPSVRHPFGTDTIFRDVLSRLAHGGRLSLEVAFAATVIATTLGAVVGVCSGYFAGTRVRLDHAADGLAALGVVTAVGGRLARGAFPGGAVLATAIAFGLGFALRAVGTATGLWSRRWPSWPVILETALAIAAAGSYTHPGRVVILGAAALVARALTPSRATDRYPTIDLDDGLMRTVDALLAFPFLLLAMAIAAAVDRTSEATLFLLLGLTAWTGSARVIRGKTLQVRDLDFVVAARALGASTPSVIVRHVLPNVAGLIIVLGTSSVASMIVAEAALSFLGLSLPPPTPSWGGMLDEARPYYALAPWLMAAPAVAILLTVLGFNLLGEGLRDAFDPKE